MASKTDHTDEIELRAAEWVARLEGVPLSEAEAGELRAWLDDDPNHRAAFEEAAFTWRELSMLRRDPGPLQDLLPRSRRPSATGRAARIGVVTGLLIFGAGFVCYQTGNMRLLDAADYRTATGELRTITLADGSTVELGPASAIALNFNDTERRIRLLSGEVFFAAASRGGGETRPFVVEAAGGTTTALGTQFVVEDAGDGVDVLAVEHQIEVTLEHAGERQRQVLSPGQEVRYAPGAGIGQVRMRAAETATAWRRGLLVFDGTSLGHVVETLNRYRRGRIVILDGELARRRVSGVFATKDLGDAIETITAELGIGKLSISPFITVLY